jgi:Mrp family chromosome partitioning ATPase
MTGHPGMDLPRFLELVRARKLLIIGIVGSIVGLVLALSLSQSSRYQATADLLFGRSSGAEAVIAGGSGATEVPETKAATNLALASLDRVASRVKSRLRTPLSIDELKGSVDITLQGDSDIANVTAEASTPAQAAALADAFAEEIVALRREAARADIQRAIDALEQTLAEQPAPTPAPGAAAGTPTPETEAARTLRERISELQVLRALETGGVYVVEPATPPTSPSSPRPLRNAMIAGFLALGLALAVVVLLARFDERIRDEDELAALMEVPVLARIPERARARRMARGPHEDKAFLEAFEFLRQNLQLMDNERGGMVIAVTSAANGDGKTTVVSWLARSLALGGGEVVAVDLDVRKPELHRSLSALDQAANGVPPARRGDAAEQPAGAAGDGRRRVHSTEEVEAGLRELVRRGGSVRSAARSLKEAGRDIPESTLRRWKIQHASLYEELAAEHGGGGADDGATRVDDLTRPTAHARVRLLSRGDQLAQPLQRERLQRLFAQLHDNADYVVVDTVPVSTVADASAVVAAAHGVILVVDLERTRRRDLLAARTQLDHARADVLGIVLNRAAVTHHAYEPVELDEPVVGERPG